jgi:hypothetical protein
MKLVKAAAFLAGVLLAGVAGAQTLPVQCVVYDLNGKPQTIDCPHVAMATEAELDALRERVAKLEAGMITTLPGGTENKDGTK